MAYTPPAYNVVNADLKPVGSAAVTIPAYNVVNANLSVEDGGGGGSSQTIIPSGINSTEFGTPTFLLFHSFVTPSGINSEESFGYPVFQLGTFYIQPYSVPSAEYVGYHEFRLKVHYITPYSIVSDEAVGYPEFVNLTQITQPFGIDSEEVVGLPSFVSLKHVINFSSIHSDEDFGLPEFRLVDTYLEFEFSTGEDVSVDVSTDGVLVVDYFDGGVVEVDLCVDTAVDPFIEAGEELSVGVETYPQILLDVDFGTGEEGVFELDTNELFDISVGSGEEVEVELTAYPRHEIDIVFESGDELSVSLTTQPLFENLGEVEFLDGAAVDSDLDVPEGNALSVVFSVGVDFYPETISTASSLGSLEFFDGITLDVASVDELSNYRFADGVIFVAEMSVSASVDSDLFDGVELSVDIDTRPPAGLSCTLWEGAEFAFPSMNLLVSAPLRVTFGEGVYITATESTSTTSFDLEGDPVSYPNRLQWWLDMNQFEFIDMLPSFVWGHGTGIVVQADLQARPRFSISCATGESFAMVRGYDYMEVEAFSGLQGLSQEFIHLEPHINLCYPNVIPNADAMEVELDFNEETCYADFLYEGQYLRSALSCVYTVAPVQWVEGSRLDFDLTISDPWRLRFWVGERLDFYLGTVPVFPISFSTGESLRGTFEEPSVPMATGESVELELTITFEVEFLEQGCLDNEYKYMTPNGDEDKEKFNPVAVELEPFAHEIKARCF